MAAGAWLTLSVQLGFVCGTLVSAILNLADRLPANRLFAGSAAVAAVLNGLIGLHGSSFGLAMVLRFGTGAALAGVYPPAIKIASSWFRDGRGLAIGVVLAAFTLGSSVPELLAGSGGLVAGRVLAVSSALAALAAIVVARLVPEGPFSTPAARLRPTFVVDALRDVPVRLAIFGYLGHMWELYAFWTWLPAFTVASLAASGTPVTHGASAWIAFLAIGVGAIGAVAGGLLADRYGRTMVTAVALVASGASCIGACLAFGGSPLWLALILPIWGVSVIADSAQFSAAVAELAEPAYVGTALTVLTSLGFLLTFGSIRLIPALVSALGWHWAMLPLVIGPIFGVSAMVRLRALPDALRMAGGRR